VVFVSGIQPRRFLPFDVLTSSTYRTTLVEAIKDAALRSRLLDLPLFQRYVGHGITQGFTPGQDTPYKAVMSAFKASLDRIKQFSEVETEPGVLAEQRLMCIVFPVVVIDGRLFEYSVGEAGKWHIVEVESSALYWKGMGRSYSSTLVHVVTRPGLAEFIQQANEATGVLIEIAMAHT
jgi:hypothetical protein